MATYNESDWDELTIHEMLAETPAKKYSEESTSPEEDSRSSQQKIGELEAMGPPSGAKASLHKRKRSHKKVPAKEKTLSSPTYLKFTVDVAPPLPDLAMIDQSSTIHSIDTAIADCEGEMTTWPTPQTQAIRPSDLYGEYSVQQKREILGALQGRVANIQSNITAARTALEKIIRFFSTPGKAMKQSIFTTFLHNNSDDSDFDLPSPTLIARSGMSTPDLFMPPPTQTGPAHFRDPSFAFNSSEIYEVQPSPVHPPKPLFDSPKFSGSSVFDSRAINPLNLTPKRKIDLNSTSGRAGASTVTPLKRLKPDRLLPELGTLRKQMDTAISLKREFRVRAPTQSPKKVPPLHLPAAASPNEVPGGKHWTMTPLRRLTVKKALGYTPKQTLRPVIVQRQPLTARSGKSPIAMGKLIGRV